MTIQAASIIRRVGLNVHLFDSNLKESPEEIRGVLQLSKPKYVILVDDGFNYLTKMCLSVMREAAFSMMMRAKEQGCVVIVNSSDAADHAAEYLKQGADYVIHGEVEETLEELLTTLESKNSTELISGISFLTNSHVVTNPPRSVLRDLDKLPMPAWDLIDMNAYRAIWMKYHGYFSLNMATTRGCPYKCNWCAKPIYGNRYNTRSPEHVINEIAFLLARYKPDHFWMCDDIFGLKPGWVQEFKQLVEEKKLSFKFKIQSRVDLLLGERMVDSLASCGAETIWVGAESGSQKILDAMDKGTTVDQIQKATQLLKNRGIKVGYFLQFGYLGETKEDIEATVKMVLDSLPDEIGISVSYPLPGTKFHEKVKGMLKEKTNWTDSDDLAMLYVGTYTPEYYKVLHRYVHNRYRIQRGINQLRKSILLDKTGLRNVASMIYNTPLSWLNAHQLNRLAKV
jgi:anaerobic magnesium-protoporphyrin IX monomethyl ester cyclase